MDGTTELLSTCALDLDYSHLPPETIHETKRRIIDSMGCAMGGFASEPAKIARHMAATTTSTLPSRVLGSGQRGADFSRDGGFYEYGDGTVPGFQRYLRVPRSRPSQRHVACGTRGGRPMARFR